MGLFNNTAKIAEAVVQEVAPMTVTLKTDIDALAEQLKELSDKVQSLSDTLGAVKQDNAKLQAALVARAKEQDERADSETSKKAVAMVAGLGVDPVFATKSTNLEGKTILEKFASLTGKKQAAFYEKHKAEILNSIQ